MEIVFRRASLALLVALAASCASLEELTADGSCGNKVLEDGEDCDGFGESSDSECSAAGRAHACRYVCGLAATRPGATCPSGWICGTDGICRDHARRFGELEPILALDRPPIAADLDGDESADLVAVGFSGVTAWFGDGRRGFGSEVPIEVPELTDLEVLDLDLDEKADLVVTTPAGLHVILGDEARSLTPVTYEVPEGQRLMECYECEVVSVRAASRVPVDDLLVVTAKAGFRGGEKLIAIAQLLGRELVEYSLLSVAQSGRLARPVVADVDALGQPGAEEIAIFFSGGDEVLIVSPGCADRRGRECSPVIRSSITLPKPLYVGACPTGFQGVALGDVDGDGFVDLIAELAGNSIAVSYGDGRGGFCSHAARGGDCASSGGVSGRAEIDLRLEDVGVIAFPTYCGVADLDRDGRVELVSFSGEVFSSTSASGRFEIVARATGQPIAFGDFNADGIDDLVSGALEAQSLSFLFGTPTGALNEVRVPGVRRGDLSSVAVGDFDGDGADDLSYANQQNEARVLFGRPFGVPGPDIRMADLSETAVRLVAGDLVARDGELASFADPGTQDAIADLAVVIESEARVALVLLAGSSRRRMFPTSAVDLSDPVTLDRSIPVATWAGRFGPNADPLPDLLALTYTPGDTFRYMLSLHEAQGAGRFARVAFAEAPPCVSPDSLAGSIAIIDLEGDGRDEILFLPPGGFVRDHALHVLRADGLGTLVCDETKKLSFADVGRIGALSVEDLNGDGAGDLLFRYFFESERIDFYVDIERPLLGGAHRALAIEGSNETLLELAPVRTISNDIAVLTGGSLQLAELDGDVLRPVSSLVLPPISFVTTFVRRPLSPRPLLDIDRDGFEDLLLHGDAAVHFARQLPVRE
jgi:hypothetical protein